MKPSFFEATRDARKVLVIDPGLLGDAIHALPALWELRRNYTQAELHVIASPVGAEVLRLAGCVDRAWPLEQSSERRTLKEQWRTLRALRGLRFDASINFADHDRNVFHAAFAGARKRLTLRGDRWHFWSPWLIPFWIDRGRRDIPVYEQRRQFLARAGFAIGDKPHFGLQVPAAAAAWAASSVPSGAIHLSINASSPYKEWPVAQWAALACLLTDRGLSLVATSSNSPREIGRLRELEQSVPPGTVRLFPGGLEIPQFAALLQRCRLHVGADSGAIHLAMALGLPTVGIYREYSGRAEWTPAASPNIQITGACRCEAELQPDCRAAATGLCLKNISPDEVVSRGVEPLLKISTCHPS